ncbi:MAG: YVTN family beta-propeller protein [Flavobacteriales bacterium]|jgi:YVTN family beta-propeller protein
MSKLLRNSILILICFLSGALFSQGKQKIDSSLYHLHSITGRISPKSVVHNGKGVFFAQNMMYKHTVTVYDRNYKLLKTIKDRVDPATYGWPQYTEPIKGGPVECCFSPDGKYAWVSNYNMSGGGAAHFNKPGCDGCSSSSKYDSSFVYKINTSTLNIEAIIQVGSIPKYCASTPDGKLILVTNWTSGDLSIIDVAKSKEMKRIKLGNFPRGIVVDSQSKFAYITIMGSCEVIKLNLTDYTKKEIKVGKGPRHLCISPDDQYLYITLNSENRIGKLNLSTLELQKVRAGHQPRSMAIDKEGKYLYVVNYNDANFTKYDAKTMLPIAITKTKSKPIGITYDNQEKNVWVACYSGYVQIFKDSLVHSKKTYEIPTDEVKLIVKTGESDGRVADMNVVDSTELIVETKLLVAKRYAPKYFPVKKDFSANIARYAIEKEEALLLAQLTLEEDKKEYDRLQILKEQEVLLAVNLAEKVKKAEEEEALLAMNLANKKQKEKEKMLKAQQQVKPDIRNSIVESFSADNGKFLVVLGAFGKSENVSKLQVSLKKKGIETLTYYNPIKKVTYVCAGQFKEEKLAESMRSILEKQDTESWVFKEAK